MSHSEAHLRESENENQGTTEKLQKLGAKRHRYRIAGHFSAAPDRPGQNVLELAGEMLEGFGSLYLLMTSDKAAFGEVKGIGDAKVAQLHAVAELAKRFFASKLVRESAMENPQITRQYLQSLLAHQGA